MAHIRTTHAEALERSGRTASILSNWNCSSERKADLSAWYAERVGDLSTDGREDRGLRMALLAAEGAFYLRNIIGFQMSETIWHQVFEDVGKIADGLLD